MKIEIWKPVVGYEGLYEVSNWGIIKALPKIDEDGHKRKERLLKPCYDSKKYLIVKLSKNKITKNYKVHRLVAEAFIPNPNNLPQVNHKDENKTNNVVTNLEWCDAKYNNSYGTRKERISKSMKEYRKK